MRTLHLGLRLVLGGGRAGLGRIALMVVGLAVGVVVALAAVTVPGVLGNRAQLVSARLPLTVQEGTVQRFQASLVPGMWGDRRFTKVVVADVADAPRPPGVTRLPGPGEVVLSPAAAKLADRDADFAADVAGRRAGTIGPDGLAGPDELYAYVGLAAADGQGLEPARDWGGSGVDETVRHQFASLPWQMAAVLAGPLAIYLTVCSRLSAASRRRRWAALSLIGMDRARMRRVAFVESAVIGGLGALAGVAGYAVVNRFLGPSGLMGFTWYPRVSSLSPTSAVVLVVCVALVAGSGGGRAVARATGDPVRSRFDGAEPAVRWWTAVPFVLGVTVLAEIIMSGHRTQTVSGRFALTMVGAIVLASAGLLPAVRSVSLLAARHLAAAGPTPAIRIGARRVEAGASRLVSHLAGLCLLVLVASIGSAVLLAGADTSVPTADQLVTHVYANQVPQARVAAMTSVPSARKWVVQSSVVTPPGPGMGKPTFDDYIKIMGVKHLFADCQTLRAELGAPLTGCQDGQDYRLVDTTDPVSAQLQPGKVLDYDDGPLTVPGPILAVPGVGPFPDGPVILTATDVRTRTAWSPDVMFYYHLKPVAGALDAFASAVSRVAPAVVLNVYGLDADNLEMYRAERGVLKSAMGMAFILALGAYLVSAAARAAERRRDDVALIVIGATRRTLRSAQRFQLVLPLLLALPVACAVGWLSANALLFTDNHRTGWYSGDLAPMAALAAAALLTAWLAGSIVAGSRLRAEDLQNE